MSQKPIRVLQVGMSDNYGGTETTIYGLYRHLDHTLIQFDFLNVYGHPIAKQAELESQGAHVYDLLLRRREGYCNYIKGIKNFYKNHSHEFDAVQCNVQCLDQVDMAKFAKQYQIKKTIVYAHNAGYGIRPSKMAFLSIWWNKTFCHRFVDQRVACSRLAADFTFSKNDAKNATIINTGIETEKYAFSAEKRVNFRKRYGYDDATIVYGSAGRFDPQKNQLFLVSIFAGLYRINSHARFFISGRGPLEDELRKAISHFHLENVCTIVTAFIDYQEFYSGIDAFIFPSLFEGLGLVLLEAQCSGLPCFASKSTIPEEAKILPSYCPISLKLSPEEWARIIVRSPTNEKREDCSEIVRNSGNDIETATATFMSLLKVIR